MLSVFCLAKELLHFEMDIDLICSYPVRVITSFKLNRSADGNGTAERWMLEAMYVNRIALARKNKMRESGSVLHNTRVFGITFFQPLPKRKLALTLLSTLGIFYPAATHRLLCTLVLAHTQS